MEQADQLVAQLMQRLAQSFSEQRSNLEKQWEAAEKVSTEELRVGFTRYRSFFERLLSINGTDGGNRRQFLARQQHNLSKSNATRGAMPLGRDASARKGKAA